MFIWIKTEPIKMEQHGFGTGLYWVFLHEAKERVQGDPLDQQFGGKVLDAVPEAKAWEDKEDHEGGER